MQITLNVLEQNGWHIVNYIGPINEEAEMHFKQLIDNVGKNCIINFENVEFINSCGVRAWINFMRDFQKDRLVRFERCTPEVVMQMNMIPSFKGNATIGSVFAPFTCSSCSNHQIQLFSEGNGLPQGSEIELPTIKCEKCGGELELDELEDEYFAFMVS